MFSLERLRHMLQERNIAIVLNESAKELLANEGYDPSFGARAAKAGDSDTDSKSAAMKLLRGEILPGQTVTVSARNGENGRLQLRKSRRLHKFLQS
jgi:ATP-dependent Clp protease ATP-binding subunit ClpB